MDRDYLLELYQTRLEDLKQDYESVEVQLRTEQDGPTINKLERQIEQIGRQMDKLQQQIVMRQAELELQATQAAVDSLIALLNHYPDKTDSIIQAYKRTLTHWPVSVDSGAATVEAIIKELEMILPGPAYMAKDEFIAHLVHDTEEPSLVKALVEWGQRHREGMDWLRLHSQIMTEQKQRFENAQPAILITITRSDEASTQAPEDETYYQLNAWLIEDIKTYTGVWQELSDLTAKKDHTVVNSGNRRICAQRCSHDKNHYPP